MNADLKRLTDDELMSQWKVATHAMNAVYKELRLFAPGFDVIGEAEVRKRFYQESAICQKFAVEARLRGLVTDADWKKQVNL